MQNAVSVYHSTNGRFCVSLPSTWTKQEQSLEDGYWGVAAQSPEEGGSGLFPESVLILITPAHTTDLAEAASGEIETLKQNLEQFTLLYKTVGNIGQHSASWFAYTFSLEGSALKAITHIIINGSERYSVEGLAPLETFEQFRPLYESIVASIVFDYPATPRAGTITPSRSNTNVFNAESKPCALIGLTGASCVMGIIALIIFIIMLMLFK